MAALTFQSVVNTDRTHTVTKSTADAIGAAAAAVIIDSTATKIDVMDALNAAMRAVSREFGKASAPAGVPTSGATTE